MLKFLFNHCCEYFLFFFKSLGVFNTWSLCLPSPHQNVLCDLPLLVKGGSL